jgi:dephospho-CoA kinase
MLKIGLTGGIGSGKTTVAKLFAELLVPIIDADEIAHELVKPEQPALERIKQVFGVKFISSDGSLDRKKMRDCIFSDDLAKQKLEAILHPLVYASILSKVEQLNTSYCIICIPLLFETNMEHSADRILVIDCPVEQQLERVKKRENMTTEQIQSIINSQIAREMRVARADDIIDNTKTEANLIQQVSTLHRLYTSLSTY